MENISKIIINDAVIFFPKEHELKILDSQNRVISLNIPASECLFLLLKKSGDVVNRKEFFHEVWESKGLYVTPNTFYQNISLLRRALKSAGLEDNVIRTVSKQGIRFSGKIEIINDNVSLDTPISGGRDKVEVGNENIVEKTELTNKKIRNIYTKKKKIITSFISIGFLLFIASSAAIISTVTEYSDFFEDYTFIGKVNECSAFAKKSEIGSRKNHYINLLESYNVRCQKGQVAYLISNVINTKMSVTICDESIKKPSSCVTWLYAEGKNEKES